MDPKKVGIVAALFLVVAVVGYAGVAMATSPGADEANEVEEPVPAGYEAVITAEEAKDIAAGEVDGTITEVELENEGEILYEVEFDDGHEVGIDPETGDVVFVVQGDAD